MVFPTAGRSLGGYVRQTPPIEANLRQVCPWNACLGELTPTTLLWPTLYGTCAEPVPNLPKMHTSVIYRLGIIKILNPHHLTDLRLPPSQLGRRQRSSQSPEPTLP